MAYNLRRRTIRQELLDETQEVPSEDEEAQESEGSESGGVSGHESEYSDATDTTRWPMRIFYGMLDQAAVNSRILLKCKLKANNSNDKCTAISCLEKISLYLIRPYLLKKYNDTVTLRRDLKVGIAAILGLDVYKEGGYERVKFPKRLRCADCSRNTDKKTNEDCASCQRPICDDHRLMFCKTCSGM